MRTRRYQVASPGGVLRGDHYLIATGCRPGLVEIIWSYLCIITLEI